jgi:hypothetical protein
MNILTFVLLSSGFLAHAPPNLSIARQCRHDWRKYPARVSHRNRDHRDKERLHLHAGPPSVWGRIYHRHFDNTHKRKLMAHTALAQMLAMIVATAKTNILRMV